MSNDDWHARVSGDGCRLDAPRPDSNDVWDLIARLPVSSLYLAKNQTYRGQCQLVYDPRHVARLDELTPDEWLAMAADLHSAQTAVIRAVNPDHVNVESLGNVVPHLHWHIVPRYVGDARWGEPIWMSPLSAMPDHRLGQGDRAALIAAIRRELPAGS
jgi:diadenosine tetraphosphate (Ap4A) HIT family hydrolase